MLKRAAMVGIIAAGCNVEDLEAATVPVTRFLTRTGSAVGGITVRLVPGDPQSVALRFLSEDGMDLDEAAQRKIERLYDREESRRVLAAEIGDIGFASRTLELYTNELTSLVDLDAIRAARFKLVLDYAFGTASFVMPNVLGEARGGRSRHQPERLDVGCHRLRPGRARRPAGRSRPVLGCQSRGDAGPRRGAADPCG